MEIKFFLFEIEIEHAIIIKQVWVRKMVEWALFVSESATLNASLFDRKWTTVSYMLFANINGGLGTCIYAHVMGFKGYWQFGQSFSLIYLIVVVWSKNFFFLSYNVFKIGNLIING